MASKDLDAMHRHMVKLDGEFHGLRTQLTQMQKKLASVHGNTGAKTPPTKHATEEIQQLRRYLEGCIDKGIADVRGELRQERQKHDEQQRRIADLCGELRQECDEQQRMHRELTRQHRSLEQKLDKKPTGNTEIIESKLMTTQWDLANFKKQIYDSGVLMPKIEVEVQEDPPVGTLELGQNALSARLLIRLGMRLYKDREAKPAYGELEETGELSDDSWEHPEDLVHGLKEIELTPGMPGYFSLTKGWLGTCAFAMMLQLVALVNIFLYGLEHGDNCLQKAPDGVHWWTLHLSKAAGTVVVGIMMAGDIMDTVNYFMVSVLLEPKLGVEILLSVVFQSLVTVLTVVANTVLFIIATSPDGIWLYVAAVGFVTELSKAVLGIAKSGILGHHIAKEVTDMNFQLCFLHQYPWWFQPVRIASYVVLFGFIMFFALYVSFLPVQECPADGSHPRNVFYHFTPEFSQV